MLAVVLTAIIRFIADSTNPFFLMPAAECFFKSVVTMFCFGLIVRVIAVVWP